MFLRIGLCILFLLILCILQSNGRKTRANVVPLGISRSNEMTKGGIHLSGPKISNLNTHRQDIIEKKMQQAIKNLEKREKEISGEKKQKSRQQRKTISIMEIKKDTEREENITSHEPTKNEQPSKSKPTLKDLIRMRRSNQL